MDCIFCKIVNGEIPSKKLYEDERVLAFYDIEPKAPVHVLVIPKQHLDSVLAVNEENADVVARIFSLIPKLVEKLDLPGSFRVVSNCGEDAGQTVRHLHFHILGGKTLSMDM